jgi:L-iditol 2-dehydrogenase
MRAAVLYGKEDLRIESLPVPEPAPGEIVVRVHAALTCGTDLKVYRRGYHARMLRPPIPFGHELAGTVHSLGEGVTRFREEDRVVALNSAPCDACFFCLHGQQNLCDDLLFNNGAYAEYIRVPARIVEKNTLLVPEDVPLEHAALTEPLACCIRGMEESGITPDQTVAVIGAGPIGLLFIRAVSLLGATVIAVVKRDEQVALASRFGATYVVQTTQSENSQQIIAAVRDFTPDHRGPDAVLEAVALPQTWQWAVEMVRKGGTVNFFGGPPSGTKVELDTNLLHYSDISLKASFHHTPATVRRAFGMVCDPNFHAGDFLTRRSTLEDLQPALQRMMQRTSATGEIKIVIDPWKLTTNDRSG